MDQELLDAAAYASSTHQVAALFWCMMRDFVQNMMTFNKCSINGRSYGDAYDEVGNPIDVTDVRNMFAPCGSCCVVKTRHFIFHDNLNKNIVRLQ